MMTLSRNSAVSRMCVTDRFRYPLSSDYHFLLLQEIAKSRLERTRRRGTGTYVLRA